MEQHPVLKIEEYKGFKLQTVAIASCDNCIVANHPILKCSDTPCSGAEREDANNVSFIEALPTEQHKDGLMQPISCAENKCDFCFYKNKSCSGIECSISERLDNNSVFFIQLEKAKPTANKSINIADFIKVCEINDTELEVHLGRNTVAYDCTRCTLEGLCKPLEYEIDNDRPCISIAERLEVEGVYFTKA